MLKCQIYCPTYTANLSQLYFYKLSRHKERKLLYKHAFLYALFFIQLANLIAFPGPPTGLTSSAFAAPTQQ